MTSALAGVGLDAAFPELGWWPIAFVSVTLALLALAGLSREAIAKLLAEGAEADARGEVVQAVVHSSL